MDSQATVFEVSWSVVYEDEIVSSGSRLFSTEFSQRAFEHQLMQAVAILDLDRNTTVVTRKHTLDR